MKRLFARQQAVKLKTVTEDLQRQVTGGLSLQYSPARPIDPPIDPGFIGFPVIRRYRGPQPIDPREFTLSVTDNE